MQANSTYFLLVGTYTRTQSDGIYAYSFDAETGETALLGKTSNVKDPSYLASSPDRKFVFAVNESGEAKGDHVSSFKFDAATGALSFINKVASGGIHPCYITMDASAKKVYIANYTSGSLSEISVNPEGDLKNSIFTIQYNGKSIHPERQAGPHIHATVFSPDHKRLFVTDLGADKVKTYKSENGVLKLVAELNTKAGSGPRHLIFSRSGKFAYLILELNATVSVYKHSEGVLEEIQTIAMEPQDFSGSSSAADIHLSHDGKFLYASNRGTANELVIYSVNEEDGKLAYVDRTSSLGITPRNFIIDATDRFLLVANQESNDIYVFNRDVKTGKLTYTEKKIEVEAPVCLHLIKATK